LQSPPRSIYAAPAFSKAPPLPPRSPPQSPPQSPPPSYSPLPQCPNTPWMLSSSAPAEGLSRVTFPRAYPGPVPVADCMLQNLTHYGADICSRPLKQNGKTVASPSKLVQAWPRSLVSSSTIRASSTTSLQRMAIRIILSLPLGSILMSSQSPTRSSHLS